MFFVLVLEHSLNINTRLRGDRRVWD